MKTKPFLLATAGSTVDGRNIEEKTIREMATSYDPKTYTALINIEHVRSYSGQAPFNCYGTVLELSTAEVDVNFNGKTEKRLGLFGVFDVNDQAKALNDAGQKNFPSIEIMENFGGKNFAYLGGCALTDSPASIATDRLKFNRQMPGSIKFASDDLAAALEFAADEAEPGAGILASFKSILDGFAAKITSKAEGTQAGEPEAKPGAAFDFAQLAPMFEQLTGAIAKEIGSLRSEFRSEVDALAVKFAKDKEEREAEPATTYRQRPVAAGQHGKYAKTDC